MKDATEKQGGLGTDLKKIRAILEWFDDQNEVDVEQGLERIKEGADLIVRARKRLAELENEFTEIKKKLDDDV